MTTFELFEEPVLALAPGAVLLRGFASARAQDLLRDVDEIARQAPFRHLVTPGGYTMSVAMTNCGDVGWCSDRDGYRYDAIDPLSGRPWPTIPALFLDLAARAATAASFEGFVPDACLINQYAPGAKLSLHQDRDERDRGAPIVSVSLGVPATFLFGGKKRSDAVGRIALQHGDIVVWGGPARLSYHGVLPIAEAQHPLTGPLRINLTFRKAV